MKPKHTPGPWTIDKSCDLIRNGTSNSFIQVADLKTIHNYSDARLIAAAPEMLEVLQFVKTIAKQGRPLIDSDLVAIDQAIAKATGGAQ